MRNPLRFENVIGLFVLIASAVMFFPLLVTVLTSLDPRGLVGNLLIPGVSFRWYESFFAFEPFVTGLYTSVQLALTASILAIAFSLPASLMLARRKFRGSVFLSTLFLSPLVVPGVVTGAALLFFFFSHGLRNSLANLILAHTILVIPFAIRVLTSSLIGLDPSVEEAAMSLGANYVRTFFRVTLPRIRAGLVATAVFTLATSFQEVDASIFLSIGTTKPFPIVLLSYLRQGFDPTVAAASTIILLWSLLAILILDRTLGLRKLVL